VTFPHCFERCNLALALLGSALIACGDPGHVTVEAPRDPRDTSVGDPYHCAEARRELAPGEATPFGFTAESLRLRVEGEHVATLRWQESAASYGPEQGGSEISIAVLSTPRLEFVDRSLVAREGWVIPAGVSEETYGCLDGVQLRSEVRVTTRGGALDELTEAVFEAAASGIVLGVVELPLEGLAGTFSGHLPVAEGLREAEHPSLQLRFGVADEALAGDLLLSNGELRSLDGSAVANTTPELIAHFPSGMGCGPEYGGTSDPQLLRRTGMADALARLNAASPTPALSDAGGPETLLELGFENRDDSVCRDTTTPVESALLFPARVELAAEDGSIAGSIEVDVVSLPQLGRVTASASQLSELPEQMADLPAEFGIQRPISLAGYRAGSVEFQSGLAQNGPWGALRAYGHDASACASGDAGVADAAVLDPSIHCGSERTLLWGMSWGTAPTDP
jgi:hypothetical protein